MAGVDNRRWGVVGVVTFEIWVLFFLSEFWAKKRKCVYVGVFFFLCFLFLFLKKWMGECDYVSEWVKEREREGGSWVCVKGREYVDQWWLNGREMVIWFWGDLDSSSCLDCQWQCDGGLGLWGNKILFFFTLNLYLDGLKF